jgi:hypothetical protein
VRPKVRISTASLVAPLGRVDGVDVPEQAAVRRQRIDRSDRQHQPAAVDRFQACLSQHLRRLAERCAHHAHPQAALRVDHQRQVTHRGQARPGFDIEAVAQGTAAQPVVGAQVDRALRVLPGHAVARGEVERWRAKHRTVECLQSKQIAPGVVVPR